MTPTKMHYAELRHDPAYTTPLLTDEEFFTHEIDLDTPGLEEVRHCAAEKNFAGARDTFLQWIGSGSKKRFYFEPTDVPPFREFIAENYAREDFRLIIDEADRITEGDLPLSRGKRVDFPNGAYDWNGWLYDTSQYQLHLVRFDYLKFLSRAYGMTGDEKYARCFNRMMDHFIDDCPMPRDGAFCVQHCTWEPLSVGVRMYSLPEQMIVFFHSASFLPEVKMKLIKSFFQHGAYIRKYHAKHGNHACMQLRGLLVIALLLPELKAAKEWLAYGLEELPKHVRQNVYEDGVQFEASPMYHVVVMRDLYELIPLLQHLGIETSFDYEGTLEKMYDVLMNLITPNGQLPRFGDTDLLNETDLISLRDVMSPGALIHRRPDFKYLGYPTYPASCLWKFGIEGARVYGELKARPPEKTATYFPIGGYMISRQDWNRNAMYLAMRAGEGINGHAHSDALSVIAYANGKELLLDSGKGLYEWNRDRKYLLSTRAHNTVAVDGQDQHVRNMHWNPPPTALCKIWDFRSGGQYDYFFACHYGYTRLDDPVIHTRKVLFVKNRYWLIVDLLEAKEPHLYEQYFHLPPGEAVCDWERRRVRTNAPDANLLLAFPESEQVSATLESGLLYLRGKQFQKPVLKRSSAKSGKVAFESILMPYRDAVPEVEVERLPVNCQGKPLDPCEATALSIRSENWEDRICLYHGNVRVDAFLDHTGNPVAESLLRASDAVGEPPEFEFAGGVHRADVIVESRK